MRAARAARAASTASSRGSPARSTRLSRRQIRWRYRLVLNGAAVVVPSRALGRLQALPGVARSTPAPPTRSARHDPANVAQAATTWQTGLTNQGAGIKIGIIDDGVDQTHPYFAPAGYTMPPGFPKGQTAYTTAKVIVARAFAPAGSTWKYARKPFDPVQSGHATHVAGIAAGERGHHRHRRCQGLRHRARRPTSATTRRSASRPTQTSGLDGNAAEIVAAIEAAVDDGMDVINLSLGEPEVEPSRDIVARALDAAAAAGVVPVVAAGNDFEESAQDR